MFSSPILEGTQRPTRKGKRKLSNFKSKGCNIICDGVSSFYTGGNGVASGDGDLLGVPEVDYAKRSEEVGAARGSDGGGCAVGVGEGKTGKGCVYDTHREHIDNRCSAMVAATFVLVIILINVTMQRTVFKGKRWEVSWEILS